MAFLFPIYVRCMDKKDAARDEARYRDALEHWIAKYSAWVEAKTRWNRLYYCNRCGQVYDPRTRRYAQSGNIAPLLYDD